MFSNIFSVSLYCERVSAGWWQEPLNTWSNLLFLLAAATAAWVCHRRDHAPHPFTDRTQLLLCVELFAVGFASWIYHASGWALFAVFDTLMILVFFATATFALLVRGVGFSLLQALGGLVAVLVSLPLFSSLPLVKTHLSDGGHYIPAILTLALVALLMLHRTGLLRSAAGLGIAFVVLLASLTLRTLDLPLCAEWQHGTHFLWHTLNALGLFWVIVSLPKKSKPR